MVSYSPHLQCRCRTVLQRFHLKLSTFIFSKVVDRVLARLLVENLIYHLLASASMPHHARAIKEVYIKINPAVA